MKHKIGRAEGEILRELSEILQKKIRDPCLNDVILATVKRINNFSYAIVCYSLLAENGNKEKEVAEGLEKTKGLVRHLLGQELTVYKAPKLISKRDTSVRYGSKIDKSIAQLEKQEDDR